MEIKYSICFTGVFINPSEQVVIERLAPFFSSINSEKVEGLIKNRTTFKRSVDLALANKIKSRLEQAGAECLIFIDDAEISEGIPVHHDLKHLDDGGKRSGSIIMASSVFLILCVLLLSNGYEPMGGFLWSLSESMYFYKGYPFGCGEAKYLGEGLHITPGGKLLSGACADSFNIEVSTRHMVFLFLCVGMIGAGRYFGAIRPARYYWGKIKAVIS